MNTHTQTDKPINVAVNGSGTIGRAVIIEMLRSLRVQFKITAINDKLPISEATLLLEHIFHERYGEEWDVRFNKAKDALLFTNPEGIKFELPYFEADGTLPWGRVEENIDIVLECSGAYRTRSRLDGHLQLGVKKVLLSAKSTDPDDVDKTVVFGINQGEIAREHSLVSNASCTTNAAAHVLRIVEDNFGFEHCFATSTHTPLNRHLGYDHGMSVELDGVDSIFGIANNVVTRKGSLHTLAPRILGQEFASRIMSKTVFAPFKGGSLMSMVFALSTSDKTENLKPEDIHQLFAAYAATMPHARVIRSFNRDTSSARAKRTPYSAIYDAQMTRISHGPRTTMLEINVWHDTAWGFAPRMLDVAQVMHEAGYDEPV